MDFETFDIAQPVGLTGGAVTTETGQCNDAVFTVTADGPAPPMICGTNSGYHSEFMSDIFWEYTVGWNRNWGDKDRKRFSVRQKIFNAPKITVSSCRIFLGGRSGFETWSGNWGTDG